MLEDDLSQLRLVIAQGAAAREVNAALEPVASACDPRTIAPLLLMLNDETKDEGLWSLVHAAEQFDDATYISHFLAAFSGVVVASSRWASIMMMRILNLDTCRAELIRQVRLAPSDTQKDAAVICSAINERDARFSEKIAAVLIAASNGN